ncbi:MAG: GNAT family N-acetyltransferase [Nocardioides sp.]
MAPRTNEHDQPIGEALAAWSPRRRPGSGPFDGRYCRVVPLRPDHAEDLFATCSAPGTEHLWTYLAGLDGPFHDPAAFADGLSATVDNPTSVSVAVTTPEGRAVGIANYMRIDPANGSVEVGGILFGTSLQRTAAATEAMYLMARHVFEDLGYRRYEWKCDDLNAPSCAAARRLGFAYEGTHRNAVVYKGRSRDTAWFSITDAEWTALTAAYEQWLDPANFDEAGAQRSSLSALTVQARSRLADAPDGGIAVPHLGTRGTLA